jgi:hypothetical protein
VVVLGGVFVVFRGVQVVLVSGFVCHCDVPFIA